MEQKIVELLHSIEKEKNITIIFAVEVGSRAWELNTAESDYDVCFVFYRNLENYISVNRADEQMSFGFDKNFKPKKKDGVFIEMTGYDIFKYFKLLSSCNITTVNWVNSNIIYLGDKTELKAYIENNINKSKLFVEYYCTAKGCYKAYTKGKEINFKKYLHVIRLILDAEYVLQYKKLPNTSMIKNLKELEKYIPNEVLKKINELIEIKKSGHGKDVVKEIPILDKYYKETFERYQGLEYEKKIKEEKIIDIDFLNKYMQKLIISNDEK